MRLARALLGTELEPYRPADIPYNAEMRGHDQDNGSLLIIGTHIKVHWCHKEESKTEVALPCQQESLPRSQPFPHPR